MKIDPRFSRPRIIETQATPSGILTTYEDGQVCTHPYFRDESGEKYMPMFANHQKYYREHRTNQ